MSRHQKENHSGDRSPKFSCLNCDKTFTRRHGLKRHEVNCSGASPKRILEDNTNSQPLKRQKIMTENEDIEFEVRFNTFLFNFNQGNLFTILVFEKNTSNLLVKSNLIYFYFSWQIFHPRCLRSIMGRSWAMKKRWVFYLMEQSFFSRNLINV